jgi:pentapeptide repeat protein
MMPSFARSSAMRRKRERAYGGNCRAIFLCNFSPGRGDIRKGGLGLILKTIAWISLVIGPVLLLLLLQVQFLPYHLEWVTWVQRVAIVVDVILLWLLWPAVLNRRSKLMWRLERRAKGWPLTVRYVAGLTACLIPVGLAFTAATFPREWMDAHIGNKPWIPPNSVTAWLGAKDQGNEPISTSFHDLLFNGDVDPVTRRRKSLFSNTLVLPDFDALEAAKIDDPKKLDSVKRTLILRGRHLESVFSTTQICARPIWRARGFRAQISLKRSFRARRSSTRGFRARRSTEHNFRARCSGTRSQGADLASAQLQGASLEDAGLQGANFRGSRLAGTNLRGAAVWRASLENASLTAVFEDGVKESASSKDRFVGLKAWIMKNVPESIRENALKRIEILNPDIFGPEASERETLERGRVDKTAYIRNL